MQGFAPQSIISDYRYRSGDFLSRLRERGQREPSAQRGIDPKHDPFSGSGRVIIENAIYANNPRLRSNPILFGKIAGNMQERIRHAALQIGASGSPEESQRAVAALMDSIATAPTQAFTADIVKESESAVIAQNSSGVVTDQEAKRRRDEQEQQVATLAEKARNNMRPPLNYHSADAANWLRAKGIDFSDIARWMRLRARYGTRAQQIAAGISSAIFSDDYTSSSSERSSSYSYVDRAPTMRMTYGRDADTIAFDRMLFHAQREQEVARETAERWGGTVTPDSTVVTRPDGTRIDVSNNKSTPLGVPGDNRTVAQRAIDELNGIQYQPGVQTTQDKKTGAGMSTLAPIPGDNRTVAQRMQDNLQDRQNGIEHLPGVQTARDPTSGAQFSRRTDVAPPPALGPLGLPRQSIPAQSIPTQSTPAQSIPPVADRSATPPPAQDVPPVPPVSERRADEPPMSRVPGTAVPQTSLRRFSGLSQPAVPPNASPIPPRVEPPREVASEQPREQPREQTRETPPATREIIPPVVAAAPRVAVDETQMPRIANDTRLNGFDDPTEGGDRANGAGHIWAPLKRADGTWTAQILAGKDYYVRNAQGQYVLQSDPTKFYPGTEQPLQPPTAAAAEPVIPPVAAVAPTQTEEQKREAARVEAARVEAARTEAARPAAEVQVDRQTTPSAEPRVAPQAATPTRSVEQKAGGAIVTETMPDGTERTTFTSKEDGSRVIRTSHPDGRSERASVNADGSAVVQTRGADGAVVSRQVAAYKPEALAASPPAIVPPAVVPPTVVPPVVPAAADKAGDPPRPATSGATMLPAITVDAPEDKNNGPQASLIPRANNMSRRPNLASLPQRPAAGIVAGQGDQARLSTAERAEVAERIATNDTINNAARAVQAAQPRAANDGAAAANNESSKEPSKEPKTETGTAPAAANVTPEKKPDEKKPDVVAAATPPKVAAPKIA